ncbi:MAG: hypothetical protein U0R80_08995 [Nocardioidaceae bacterium]
MTSSLGSLDPPPAVRARRPGWRDPRLWLGVAIVAASVVAGARLLARADDLDAVWAVTDRHAAGDVLTPDDLVARRVRFDDAADRERYLLTEERLPDGMRLERDVGPGELLPRAALGAADADTGLLTVPIGLPALSVPPDVHAGSRVDVWVTTENDAGRQVARPRLRDVVVISAPPATDGFGAAGDRQLVLGVAEDQEDELGAVLAAVGEAPITVVGRGGSTG